MNRLNGKSVGNYGNIEDTRQPEDEKDPIEEECEECGGTGEYDEGEYCDECDGTGVVYV